MKGIVAINHEIYGIQKHGVLARFEAELFGIVTLFLVTRLSRGEPAHLRLAMIPSKSIVTVDKLFGRMGKQKWEQAGRLAVARIQGEISPIAWRKAVQGAKK